MSMLYKVTGIDKGAREIVVHRRSDSPEALRELLFEEGMAPIRVDVADDQEAKETTVEEQESAKARRIRLRSKAMAWMAKAADSADQGAFENAVRCVAELESMLSDASGEEQPELLHVERGVYREMGEQLRQAGSASGLREAAAREREEFEQDLRAALSGEVAAIRGIRFLESVEVLADGSPMTLGILPGCGLYSRADSESPHLRQVLPPEAISSATVAGVFRRRIVVRSTDGREFVFQTKARGKALAALKVFLQHLEVMGEISRKSQEEARRP